MSQNAALDVDIFLNIPYLIKRNSTHPMKLSSLGSMVLKDINRVIKVNVANLNCYGVTIEVAV